MFGPYRPQPATSKWKYGDQGKNLDLSWKWKREARKVAIPVKWDRKIIQV